MNYLFYLEPYTFLLCGKGKTIVYNTLNAAYLICPDYPIVQLILEQWKSLTNGYCALLDKKMMENEIVTHFVKSVRESFSGDCIKYDEKSPKPYIFLPTLFLNSDIRVAEEKKKTSLGNRVMENLNEINLYLPATCELKCQACTSYFHQMNHCTIHSENKLNIEDYRQLIRQLLINGIKRVNLFAGGNPNRNNYVRQLLLDVENANIGIHLYLDYTFLCSEYEELVRQTKCVLEILVHKENWGSRLSEDMKKFSYDRVKWNLIVSNEADMEHIERMEIPTETMVQIKPFYTGDNLDFFRKYVYIDMQDILATPVDRKTIFRHRILNDNFFGKLTIYPSGEVYANVNFCALGNIQNLSLKELLYTEITDGDVWLRVRNNEKPCNQCVNRDLCPSISNYELVIGKNNLCNIPIE